MRIRIGTLLIATSILMLLGVSLTSVGVAAPATQPAAGADANPIPAGAAGWTPLFNGKDLTGWYTFLNGPGKNSDPNHVFTIHDGVIHLYQNSTATRPTTGYFCTEKEYGDCRIRVQFKWGDLKGGARPARARNSGLLYFVFGDDGKFSGTWPQCVQCQIKDGDVGDSIALGTAMSSTVDPATAQSKAPTFKDAKDGGVVFTTAGQVNDRIIKNPLAETVGWNTIEVVLEGDASVHIVNGKTNMKLMSITRPSPEKPTERVPLRRGRIAFQGEGNEILFKSIEMQPLGKDAAGKPAP